MSDRSVVNRFIGAVVNNSTWTEMARLLGRRHRVLNLKVTNKTNSSISVRVRESDTTTDGSKVNVYGASLTVVPGGFDNMTLTWQNANVFIEAKGASPGTVIVEELTPVEAFDSDLSR